MGMIKRFASEDYVKSEIQTELGKIDLSTIEPKENDIPRVFINGAIPTTKDDVNAELTYISLILKIINIYNFKYNRGDR